MNFDTILFHFISVWEKIKNKAKTGKDKTLLRKGDQIPELLR